MSDPSSPGVIQFVEKNTADSMMALPTCKIMENDVKHSQGATLNFSH